MISLLLATPQASAVAQEEPLTDSKRADIDQLLQLTTASLLVQLWSDIAVKDITESMTAAMPGLPATATDVAVDETRKVIRDHANEFLKQFYPVYNKLFTRAEIRELLTFYKTPLGEKLRGAAPLLMSEGLLAGQKEAKTLYPDITQRVIARLQKEGFIKR
jgi:hypothetical protein